MLQAFKDLNRLREIVAVALRHGFGEMVHRSRLSEVLRKSDGSGVDIEQPAENARESTAKRFRLFLSELGPTFVKLGQILSARPDLLPAEYIQELSLLQDAVPPEPAEHVVSEIEQSFGRPVREIFQKIDEEPLASASIAQVHRALTLDGEEVVVKVQRPGIAARIRADLDLLHYAARALEAVVEETAIYSPVGIIEEFDSSIHAELDFRNEARNVRDFYANSRALDYVVVPKVFDDLCSRTVLVMEYVKGEKIRSIDLKKHDRKLLASRIIEASFRQLFQDRLFHGDPHPGNILVMDGDKLGLLDFGVVGRPTRQMQESLVLLVLAVALRDADTVARLLCRIATPNERTNLSAFRRDIQTVLDTYLADSITLDQIDSRQLIPQLFNLAVRYKIRVPKEYAILSRASVAVEGLIRWLHPELNVSEAVAPYAKELLFSKTESLGLGTIGMRALLRFQTYATDLPVQLSQILNDLEAGRFKVNFASDDFELLTRSIKGLGLISFLGFIACGLTIGALISFSKLDFAVRGIPVIGSFAVMLVGFLFGVVSAWTFSSGRWRKLSISRWLKNRTRRMR